MLRLTYALLILWQPLWHGWVVPERYALGIFLAIVLLLPAWGIYLQRPRAKAIGGFLAIFYLVIATMLILTFSWPAMIQIGLCLVYLAILMSEGWQRRRQIKRSKTQ